MNFPRRIVCLSDETAEMLYLLGEQDRIVGVSGFSSRPPEVRNKPRVSTFADANVDAILALQPDIVLTFSDVQAEITRQLSLRGLHVLNFNQRSVEEIFDAMALLARLVDRHRAGDELIGHWRRGLETIAQAATRFPRKPRVYFEEWNDPLISGIRWVEELIEKAGGKLIFPELSTCKKAQDRVVDPAEVIRHDPDVIFASWCGMKVNVSAMMARPGWDQIAAVRTGHIYEIPSNCILQPGPAALTDGIRMLHEKLAHWAASELPANRPSPAATPLSCKI